MNAQLHNNVVLCTTYPYLSSGSTLFYPPEKFGGIAGNDRMGRDVFGDDAAGADDCMFADGNVREDGASGTDGGAPLHASGFYFPVCLGLQCAFPCCRPRVRVVDEGDIMADKHIIFDGDAFADEGVARNLAVPSDRRVFLYFDEGADFRIVADCASVEVDELGELDIFSQPYVISYAEIIHRYTISPLFLSDLLHASRSLTTRMPAGPSLIIRPPLLI